MTPWMHFVCLPNHSVMVRCNYRNSRMFCTVLHSFHLCMKRTAIKKHTVLWLVHLFWACHRQIKTTFLHQMCSTINVQTDGQTLQSMFSVWISCTQFDWRYFVLTIEVRRMHLENTVLFHSGLKYWTECDCYQSKKTLLPAVGRAWKVELMKLKIRPNSLFSGAPRNVLLLLSASK